MTKEWLRAKFKNMEKDGLVDLKFDIELSHDMCTPEAVFDEVKNLFVAVENGHCSPLDFNDSNRVLTGTH